MDMKRIATWAAVLTLCTAASASAQLRAVRVDAFALMTGTLHAGMDFMIGEKLSLDASLYWNPMRLDAFRSKLLVGQAGVRFWRFEPNVGPFVGTYIAAGRYYVRDTRREYFTPWSEDEIIRRSRRLMLLPSKVEASLSYLF